MKNKKTIKKLSKTKIERSLNTLFLIIVLLSFGLVGGFVYKSNISANYNKITGQVTGLERVSGFVTQTLPGTTKFGELKVDDLIDGQQITKIEKDDASGTLTIYIRKSIEEYKVKASGADPNQEIRNWLFGIGLGQVTRPTEQPIPTPQQPRKIPPEDINPPTAKENKVIEVDGKKIELKPGEAYDRVTGVIIGKQRVTTTEGPKPIYYRLRDDNVPIYVYEVDKSSGLQTIDIGGIPYHIYPELLKGAQYDKWDGRSIENIPTSSGKKEIKIDPNSQYQQSIDISKDKTETTTIYTSGIIPKIIKTEEGLTTQNPKTTTITTFYDGTQNTVISDKSGIKSTYTSQKGPKVELSEQALNQFSRISSDLEIRLIQAAFDLGITKIDSYDNGFKQGNSKVIVQDDLLFSIKGDFIVSSSDSVGNYIIYENAKVKFENDQMIKKLPEEGYKEIITNIKGELKIIQNTKGTVYVMEYSGNKKDGYNKVDITANGDRLGTLSLTPINDPALKVNGMLPFITSSGEIVYLQTSYGPFAIAGTNWYDINGKKLPSEEIQRLGLPDAKTVERAKDESDRARGQPTDAERSSQAFFTNVERVLTEFQGLGYYATLFFDEDSLLAWRDAVDRAFATLYLGTEYLTSEICGQYLDGEDIGIAYAETPQGYAQIGAHIEAVRTEPIIDENGTRTFIYKITFNVRNGDYDKDPRAPEEMNINVVLIGGKEVIPSGDGSKIQAPSKVRVFKQEQEVKRGSTFGKTGKNAIVQDSPALYNQVCLTFDEIPLRWKLDNNALCNTIQEVSSEEGQTLEELRGSETISEEDKEARRGEINDF